MKLYIFLLSALLTGIAGIKASPTPRGHSFEAGEGAFLYDGSPYVVKAAELHYPRIPRQYWEQRIRMCKALGMNTICMYVFWNIHEPESDVFDFKGENDVRHFIELCEKNGMNVILRPGPYVCAEWEMGGLPWWLLSNKDIKLRENDPYFLERVAKFEEALAKELKDKTVQNGGPIIMIQVENEYGSYGKNKEYVGEIRDILRKEWGDKVTMFQCDWSSNFLDNGLDDLVWTLNFGTGADVEKEFIPLVKERPGTPLMCSEYWSGWFDKWGANHETRPADAMISGIDDMLARGISFSLYMTHGGTNRGHWAGANSPGYSPDVTSYDYDAPVNEQGAPTEKFYMLREVMSKYHNTDSEGYMADLPEIPPVDTIGSIHLTEVAPLFQNLPPALKSERPRTMEELNQGFGSIIYSTLLPAFDAGSVLRVEEPHDYAQIYINDVRVGTLDRRLNETGLVLTEGSPGGRMDIMVEGMGRINFGRAIKDYKGITDKVTLNGKELKDWSIYLLPDDLQFYENMNYFPVSNNDIHKAGVYRGVFSVEQPVDTYLNFETWGKGLVYVNGHGLGRIWNIGPQQTIYMPGVWLREGKNEILIFDIEGPSEPIVRSQTTPVNDLVRPAADKRDEELRDISFDTSQTIRKGELKRKSEWQSARFKPVKMRYLGLELTDTQTGAAECALSEIYLLDSNGDRLSREKWSVAGGSSQQREGNHTIDKIFDQQESTYWQSGIGKDYPHRILIDLSEEVEAAGIELLPRVEKGTPGAPRKYRIVKYVTTP